MTDTTENGQETILSLDDFPEDGAGKFTRWGDEFRAADKAHKDFYEMGDKVVSKYLGGRKAGKKAQDTKDTYTLNFFNSTVNLVQDMMFGSLPKVDISRSTHDANDDQARVASLMLKNMLNAGIGTPTDDYTLTLQNALQDRLLPGIAIARVRYEFEAEEITHEAVMGLDGAELIAATTEEKIIDESVPVSYVHWRDFKWSPARTWAEVRWVAFRHRFTKDQVTDKWGEDIANSLQYTDTGEIKDENEYTGLTGSSDAYKRAEVWEIWDKDARNVVWYSTNCTMQAILGEDEDPLKLRGFYPCPAPMIANVTTSAWVPLPDFVLAQDLYNDIDLLEKRISGLTQACRLIGVYNAAYTAIGNMFTNAGETQMIPADSWDAFAEKGGLKGAIDWLPIEEIANVINKLTERRNDLTSLLYQITGISDIMRGGTPKGGAVSATERALESRFASVKIQSLQDQFARFATDLIRLRAEIISIHFDPETIMNKSDVQYTFDAQMAEPAIQLIKDRPEFTDRVTVKPESVSMTDYAQLRQERTAYITAVSTFLQSSAPIIEKEPDAGPFLMEMLKWGMAGYKGSQDIEGVLDQAIKALNAKLQDPEQQPSPEQIKAQMEEKKMQAEDARLQRQQQFDMQRFQMEQMAEERKREHERFMAMAEARARGDEINLEAEAQLLRQRTQAQLDMAEVTHATDEAIREAKAVSATKTRPEPMQ